ncbi:MAG: lytic transglycosylase [Desulfobulbus propionicus]|nr:MAG: lytic transglycosylase [Desulfobulbus propionicus]
MRIRFYCCILLFFFSTSGHAGMSFEQWLQKFSAQALQAGISKTTWQRAFAGVETPDAKVLEKAQFQPEFTLEIWDYLDSRVNRTSIGAGKIMAGLHHGTLKAIQQRFGVRPSVLLAIWSMETGYGAVLKKTQRLHYIPRALATLAHGDARRRNFAEKQLIAALKILQTGDISPVHFMGSWAGAMGHTQFIPTSYLAYGVDMDGDGRRDIWNSVADALATASRLLHDNGWRPGRTWGYEVLLPEDGATLAEQTLTLAQWQEKGFTRVRGEAFPRPEEKAELKLPAGPTGPAFLVLRNFFVLKRYNNSDAYALGVGLLADRLDGYPGLATKWPRPADSLTGSEKEQLQELLRDAGYYSGEIDAQIGAGTRQAIRDFQRAAGLPVDGRPSRPVLDALQR